MKAQFILIFSLLFVVSLSASAGNNNNDPKQQEQKKSEKPKYDFNIFKFFSIPSTQPQVDSIKPIVLPNTKKSFFFTDKSINRKKTLTI